MVMHDEMTKCLFAVLQLLQNKEFYGEKVDFVAPNLSAFFKNDVWCENLLKLEENYRCSIQIIQVPSPCIQFCFFVPSLHVAKKYQTPRVCLFLTQQLSVKKFYGNTNIQMMQTINKNK